MIDTAVNPAHYLRLLLVPVLLWASWRDIQTRRVPNRTWLPLIALGVLCMGIDAWYVTNNALPPAEPYLLQSVLTIAVTIPLAYFLWIIGGWGGADAKALIAITVVFPHYPTYIHESLVLPLEVAPHTIFPLTVLTNSVLTIPIYIAGLFAYVAVTHRTLSPLALIGRPVPIESLPDRHGKLLENADDTTLSGVDLDSIKNYLDHHNATIHDLRVGDTDLPRDDDEDPWQAEAFVDDHDNIYTPDADQLRSALDRLHEGEPDVWITPGLPFLPFLALGLVEALVLGSLIAPVIPVPA